MESNNNLEFSNHEEKRIFDRLVGSLINQFTLSEISKPKEESLLQLLYHPCGERSTGYLVNLSTSDYESIKEIILSRKNKQIEDDLSLLSNLSHSKEFWKDAANKEYLVRRR